MLCVSFACICVGSAKAAKSNLNQHWLVQMRSAAKTVESFSRRPPATSRRTPRFIAWKSISASQTGALPRRQEEILPSLIRLGSISPDATEAAVACLVSKGDHFEYTKRHTESDTPHIRRQRYECAYMMLCDCYDVHSRPTICWAANNYSNLTKKLLQSDPIITPTRVEIHWEFVDGEHTTS